MSRALRLLASSVPLLVAGCLDDRTAGTSTETENAVAARSFSVDSVLPATCTSAFHPVVATLRLDSTDFEYSKSRLDGKDLEVVRTDGRSIPFEIVYWDPLAAKGRLHVRIDPSLRAPGARFSLRSGLPPAQRSSQAAVWQGIPPEFRLLWNTTLIDDFESGNLSNTPLPVASFWFLGGFLPASGLANADSGRAGSSLHLACVVGQCSNKKGLLGATLLAASPRDFRSLDSLELWARGSGRLWIALESLDSIQMGRLQRGRLDSVQTRRAWTSFALTGPWQRFAVSPASFDVATGSEGNVGWNAIRDSINYLTILLENGSDVWLDDIRLHGILPADLQ
jgi:hypothetical protein